MDFAHTSSEGGSGEYPVACGRADLGSMPPLSSATPTVLTPFITPVGGARGDVDFQVTISCGTVAATIHYTLDGSTPTTSSPVYTGPILMSWGTIAGYGITWPGDTVVKAIAVKTGFNNSSVASVTYSVDFITAVSLTPGGGDYTPSVSVTVSCAYPGVSLFYTVDGSDPAPDGSNPAPGAIPYTGPILIDHAVTLRAIAAKAGYLTSGADTSYTIHFPTDYLGSLSGLHWAIPAGATDEFVPHLAHCTNPSDQTVTLTGTPGNTYNVTLRIRGLVEFNDYSGGTTIGQVNEGGTPQPALNVYSLAVSSPAHTFYLNAGANVDPMVVVDYTFTVQMQAGATLTLHADEVDGYEIRNWSNISVPVSGGDPAIVVTQPYGGQFLQMDVVSITPV